MGLLRPHDAGVKYIGLPLELSAGSRFEANAKKALFPIGLSATDFSNTYQVKDYDLAGFLRMASGRQCLQCRQFIGQFANGQPSGF
jgi:hypothetical protein